VGDLLEVSRAVDQVVFMYYETGLHEAESYRANMRLQLMQIHGMKAALGKESPQYLFGVGAFQSTSPLKSYRDAKIEGIDATLTALKELVAKVSPSERLIDGLAVFCEWLATTEDWAQIRNQWTGVRR
jgi:hypothetical protein